MSNEKQQIEEMAWDLCDIPKHSSIKSCEQCGNKHCHAMYYAERAYTEGYRKQSDGEWISVEELPKESGWYIVNVIDPLGISRVTLMVFTKIDGWGISDVTHWMPIPEPPMMKGGEE